MTCVMVFCTDRDLQTAGTVLGEDFLSRSDPALNEPCGGVDTFWMLDFVAAMYLCL